MGGDDTLVLIFIPTEETRLAQTGLPLAERGPLLDFVAREVIRQKASGGSYRLRGNVLEIVQG